MTMMMTGLMFSTVARAIKETRKKYMPISMINHGDGDAHDDHLDDNDGNDYDDNEKMTTMTTMTMMMTGLMFSMLARAIKET